MAQKTQHVVTATMIVARTNTIERYFDRGAVLPEDVPTEERKRLVGLSLVAVHKVEVRDETPPDPDAAAKAAADAATKVAADAKATAAAAK